MDELGMNIEPVPSELGKESVASIKSLNQNLKFDKIDDVESRKKNIQTEVLSEKESKHSKTYKSTKSKKKTKKGDNDDDDISKIE